jgi:hypothetical protein
LDDMTIANKIHAPSIWCIFSNDNDSKVGYYVLRPLRNQKHQRKGGDYGDCSGTEARWVLGRGRHSITLVESSLANEGGGRSSQGSRVIGVLDGGVRHERIYCCTTNEKR